MRPGRAPESAQPEKREIRGEPDAIAAQLRRYGDAGVDHLQVQLRPNSVDGVAAFSPVIELLRWTA